RFRPGLGLGAVVLARGVTFRFLGGVVAGCHVLLGPGDLGSLRSVAELQVDLGGAVAEQEQSQDDPGDEQDVEQAWWLDPLGDRALEETTEPPQRTGVLRFTAVRTTAGAMAGATSPSHLAPSTASRRCPVLCPQNFFAHPRAARGKA